MKLQNVADDLFQALVLCFNLEVGDTARKRCKLFVCCSIFLEEEAPQAEID